MNIIYEYEYIEYIEYIIYMSKYEYRNILIHMNRYIYIYIHCEYEYESETQTGVWKERKLSKVIGVTNPAIFLQKTFPAKRLVPANIS